MTGKFENYFLPFIEGGVPISSAEQALRIVNKSYHTIGLEMPGVAITYSANYGQTDFINKAYAAHNFDVSSCLVGGANQADVMLELQKLLNGPHSSLRHVVLIAPITTIYSPQVPGKTNEDIIKEDLLNIENLLKNQWVVLGWINQMSDPDYAVGGKGGVAGAAFPDSLYQLVQTTLKKFAVDYKDYKY